MIAYITREWGRVVFSGAAAVALSFIITGTAAAAPNTVTYRGTPVKTAVPGKPFNLKLQVKNTSNDSFASTKVILHIPAGVTDSAVSPAHATIEDKTIAWSDVPLAAGQSFYPSLTLTIDSGTAAGTKVSIWAEVTGTDMEATSKNFSVTAVSASAVKRVAATLSAANIKALFEEVYGQTPTGSELKYWLSRRTDKPGSSVLKGAIAFHKAKNIKH